MFDIGSKYASDNHNSCQISESMPNYTIHYIHGNFYFAGMLIVLHRTKITSKTRFYHKMIFHAVGVCKIIVAALSSLLR